MSNVITISPKRAKAVPTVSTSKAYLKWLKRVHDIDTPWTEAEIIFFRKAVGQSGLQDPAERALLRQEFASRAYSRGYSITDAQSVKGQQYLLSKSLKKNGEKRAGNKLGDREISILKALRYHVLVGLQRNNNCEHFLPIYRAVSTSGESFDYVGAVYDMVEVIK